jgi:P-type Cu2+ transporter
VRREGIFVREQSLWARLARVRKIIFDKTGTLTLETMTLRNPIALATLAPEHKRVLLRMVRDNLHPVSCCLRESLMAAGIEPADTGEMTEIIGSGLELHDGKNIFRLGRSSWAAIVRGNASSSECTFSRDGQTLAEFFFADSIRGDARDEIALLQKRGYEIHILSGDRVEKVQKMGSRLALATSRCHGEMSPD